MNSYVSMFLGIFFQVVSNLMEYDNLLIRIESDETQEFNLGINLSDAKEGRKHLDCCLF